MTPRRAARTDLNHAQIRDELRQLGFVVFDTHGLGDGYPDLHASKNGWSCLVEVKQPSKREDLTQDEWEFQLEWQGPYVVACSVEEVVEAYNRWIDERR